MFARRIKTRIKKGTAQKRNRWSKTPSYWNTYQNEIQLDAEPPGEGFKHFLKKRDIKLFLELLPNREEIDIRFDAVVLAKGSDYKDGWYRNGVIGICAFEKTMTRIHGESYFEAHKAIFDRLGVKYAKCGEYVECYFTENQIKAYLLLHVFLHELGHHHDKMHTKSKRSCARGEQYAEDYALKYEEIIWNRYFEHFPY